MREVNEHCVVLEEQGSSHAPIWVLSNNSLLFQIRDEMPISSGYRKKTTNALDREQDQGYVPNVVMKGEGVRERRGIGTNTLYDTHGPIRLIKILVNK